MSRTSHRFADTEIEAAESREDPRILRTPGPAPIARVANPSAADITFFDGCLAYAYGHGVGSVTLTSHRQLVDGSGKVYEDMVITGLLRAPLPSLLQLRQVINEIEKLAERAAADAVASLETPGRPR